MNSLRDCRKFWPWVFRIAWNKFQDNLRRRRRQYAGEASLLWNRSTDTPAGSDSLLDAKVHEETLEQLSELVEQLSGRQRDILRLRYYEQLPYARIASLTRISTEKARARCHRAKQVLKSRLL
ncbi:MAG: sigma-70 family RNA polymerase sigma factor [Planctomycetota bacterium]